MKDPIQDLTPGMQRALLVGLHNELMPNQIATPDDASKTIVRALKVRGLVTVEGVRCEKRYATQQGYANARPGNRFYVVWVATLTEEGRQVAEELQRRQDEQARYEHFLKGFRTVTPEQLKQLVEDEQARRGDDSRYLGDPAFRQALADAHPDGR